ncbi:MAG: D-aminoacyl-tRNA deacylase [Nitrospirota bacterium]|nr:D-aminoacyl-tRNA deacylase [Nitrospirota bacterium]
MRVVIQRVTEASVTVDGKVIGTIGKGLLVLAGVEKGDTEQDLDYMVSKITGLRIFEDGEGKMNLSVQEVGGSVLAVSQFTLLGDVRKGRRPSFTGAEEPGRAKDMFHLFVDKLRETGVSVETGEFQAHMAVSLVNDGPVTIMLDSRRLF